MKINHFTSDMLEPGKHVVKLRCGGTYILFETKLDKMVGLRIDIRSWTPLVGLRKDLTVKDDPDLDIMSVYQLRSGSSIGSLISQGHLELIWERPPEVVEIQAKEAFKILKDHFGKEVKIIEE